MSGIPFLDLGAGVSALRPEIDAAIERVVSSGWYILGEELRQFEEEFGRYLGGAHAAGVGNGTDAITLALRATVPEGELAAVVTTPMTAVPTVCAIIDAGARPDFVDVDARHLLMDLEQLDAKLSASRGEYQAVVPVHLYGLGADMEALGRLSSTHEVVVVEDVAQATGAQQQSQALGTHGAAGCFSFYPTKNLGALGDGGAVVSTDPEVIARVKSMRNYGEAAKFHNVRRGVNSRLDEIQAAVLRVRLGHLDRWNFRRRELAALYCQRLRELPVELPEVGPSHSHVFHLFVIRLDARDELQAFLKSHGVGTAIHYPKPVHLQPAFAHFGFRPGQFPVAERAVSRILSLPLYPEMAENDVERVCDAIDEFFG